MLKIDPNDILALSNKGWVLVVQEEYDITVGKNEYDVEIEGFIYKLSINKYHDDFYYNLENKVIRFVGKLDKDLKEVKEVSEVFIKAL